MIKNPRVLAQFACPVHDTTHLYRRGIEVPESYVFPDELPRPGWPWQMKPFMDVACFEAAATQYTENLQYCGPIARRAFAVS